MGVWHFDVSRESSVCSMGVVMQAAPGKRTAFVLFYVLFGLKCVCAEKENRTIGEVGTAMNDNRAVQMNATSSKTHTQLLSL